MIEVAVTLLVIALPFVAYALAPLYAPLTRSTDVLDYVQAHREKMR